MKLRDLHYGDKFRFTDDVFKDIEALYIYVGIQDSSVKLVSKTIYNNRVGIIDVGMQMLDYDVEPEKPIPVVASQKHYNQLQSQWVEQYKVKPGDVVKVVVRNPPTGQITGGNFVCGDLDKYLGNLYTVRRVEPDSLLISVSDGLSIHLPFWLLEAQDATHEPYSFADAPELLGRKLMSVSGSGAHLIVSASKEFVYLLPCRYTYKEISTMYVWLDGPDAGKPVGRLTYRPRCV